MRPDLSPAQPFLGPNDITRPTRARVERLSQEMASGRTGDPGQALRGDFSDVSRLSHALQRADADAVSLRQAERWTGAMQATLGRIDDAVAALAGDLDAGLGVSTRFAADQARQALVDVAALLNSPVGERSLFGNGGRTAPLPDVGAVLADVAALAASSIDLDDYAAQVDAYFAPGGPFEGTRLAAMPADPVSFPAGDGGTIELDVSARTRAVVDLLAPVALIAGLPSAGFEVAPNSDASLDLNARLAGGRSALPALRGSVGAVEARIADRLTQIDAARTDAEMAIADRVGIDPYETASKLQHEMARLESLYAITARRSRLRLTDYL